MAWTPNPYRNISLLANLNLSHIVRLCRYYPLLFVPT